MSTTFQDKLARITNARAVQPLARPSGDGALPPISYRSFKLHEHPGLETLPQAVVDAAKILLRDNSTTLPPIDQWVFLDTETSGLAGGAD